jgi:hypothetical protein
MDGDISKIICILLERYACNDVEQLKMRERHWYEIIKPEGNSYKPWRFEHEKSSYERIEGYSEYKRQLTHFSVTCPHCDMKMKCRSLNRHIRVIHDSVSTDETGSDGDAPAVELELEALRI